MEFVMRMRFLAAPIPRLVTTTRTPLTTTVPARQMMPLASAVAPVLLMLMATVFVTMSITAWTQRLAITTTLQTKPAKVCLVLDVRLTLLVTTMIAQQ
jgi:hypothetical protein